MFSGLEVTDHWQTMSLWLLPCVQKHCHTSAGFLKDFLYNQETPTLWQQFFGKIHTGVLYSGIHTLLVLTLTTLFVYICYDLLVLYELF